MSRQSRRQHQNKYATKNDPSLNARTALRQSTLRHDCVSFIQRLCPRGWEYDKSKATSKGYYMDFSSVVELSPTDAGELFIHHNWDGNRNFSQRHSDNLAQVIEVGVQICVAVGPDNHPWIVNGQHTLWAIHTKDQIIPCNFTVFQCKDKQSIAELFYIFDNNMVRPLSTIIKASINAGMIDSDIPAARLGRWTSALAVAENDFKRISASRVGAIRIKDVRRPEALAFAEFMEQLFKQHNPAMKLIPQGVLSAFAAMWVSDRDTASDFIALYFSGQNLIGHHPILRVRDEMFQRPEGQHSPSVCRMHSELMYTAWKRYCTGQELKQMRATKDLPRYDSWKISRQPQMEGAKS